MHILYVFKNVNYFGFSLNKRCLIIIYCLFCDFTIFKNNPIILLSMQNHGNWPFKQK